MSTKCCSSPIRWTTPLVGFAKASRNTTWNSTPTCKPRLKCVRSATRVTCSCARPREVRRPQCIEIKWLPYSNIGLRRSLDIMSSRCHDVVMASQTNLPLYAQVEDVLAATIADGSLPPGSPLPPEHVLIKRFAVSRTTIRQAVQNLIRRGLIEVRLGKGTFVTQPKISQELTELTGFVEDMQALGRQATARLLEQQIVPAGEDVARHLALTV